ncbi:TPA: hypothetical protein HA249_06750 [Candidatus Woesearchaeota archaeon]|nr:hypothetical protein [Candidatus Woesearchaeota archaeon]HII88786.1 hypothetical protein [Candidatus Woesearchaeota archaeon]
MSIMAYEYYPGQTRSIKKYSTRGVDEGPRKGQILKLISHGRTLQKAKIKLNGGGDEFVCFNPEIILTPGDKVSYFKYADGRCTHGARARDVKVL